MAAIFRGKILFGPGVTYAKLATMLANGAVVRTERLVAPMDCSSELSSDHDDRLLLFAIDEKKHLHLAVEGSPLQAKAGWVLIRLASAEQ
jgi:hypothetical protein